MNIQSERLREIFDYDPSTGIFTRRVKVNRKTVVGSVAGYKNGRGYIVISVDNKLYTAHRLAFVYMTGSCPETVDHRDGDRSNNRWDNLRPATPRQNSLNSKRPSTNKSGFKGVSWHAAAGKWIAQVGSRYGHQYLGLFDDPEEAHAAYVRAVTEIDPEFARAR